MMQRILKSVSVLIFFAFLLGIGIDVPVGKGNWISFTMPLAAEEEEPGEEEEKGGVEEDKKDGEKKDKKDKKDKKSKKDKKKDKKDKKDKKEKKDKKDKKKSSDKGKKGAGEYTFKEKEYKVADYVKDMMVKVAPGEFIMGSPASEKGRARDERQVKVKITKEFYIGKYEVTQDFYNAVMKKKAVLSAHRGKNRPVDNLTWKDAVEFCRTLNAMKIAPEGFFFFLPTEAQWEYAARGGAANAGKYTLYSGGNEVEKVAVCGEDSKEFTSESDEVGEKAPNALGLFDMSGSVAEWCYDWYAPYPRSKTPLTDPWGPGQKKYSPYTLKVVRGGSWGSSPAACRNAARLGQSRVSNVRTGVRLVLVSRKKK